MTDQERMPSSTVMKQTLVDSQWARHTGCWTRGQGLVSLAVAAVVYCSAVQIVVGDPQRWKRGCVAKAQRGM